MTECPNALVEGAILEGPNWPETVRVLSVKIRSNRLEIHAIGINTRQHYAKLIGIDEFNKTVKVSLPYDEAYQHL